MIPIIFENEYCVVLDKPAGIAVHGDGKMAERTVVDFVMEKWPEVREVGEPMETENKETGEKFSIFRPGIVHRLDKETSGVLLIAKTQESYEFFKTQFKERKTEKVYHTFVYGWPKEVEGNIDEPIGRSRGDVRKWAVGRGARGEMRGATTNYKLLGIYTKDGKEFDGKGSTDMQSAGYLEVRPKTGRTHQIRVHMKSINHAVVCDSLYSPESPKLLGFERLALHAHKLTIAMPNGTNETFIAPIPADFAHALESVAFL